MFPIPLTPFLPLTNRQLTIFFSPPSCVPFLIIRTLVWKKHLDTPFEDQSNEKTE